MPQKNKPKTLPDAELAVMKLLWKHENPVTAREIRERLYPAGTPSDHATVQKLLQRLEAKKLVRRDRSGFAHRFEAVLSQAEIVGDQLRELAQSMVEGSMVPVLSHFIKQQNLTIEELHQLKRLLDETQFGEVKSQEVTL